MASLLSLRAEAPPLSENNGVVLVGGTRVTLSSVLIAYKSGSTAEDIKRKFPSLALADIHAVIAYYLRHQEDVETYLERKRLESEEQRRKVEEQCASDGVRAPITEARDPTSRT